MAAGADWLFDVGFNATQADSDVDAFVSRTTDKLNGIGKISFNTAASKSAIDDFVNVVNRTLEQVKPVKVSMSFAGASKALRSFIRTFNQSADGLDRMNSKFAAVGRNFAFSLEAMRAQTQAMGALNEEMATSISNSAARQAAAFESVRAAANTKNAELRQQTRLNAADAESARQSRIAHQALQNSIVGVTGSFRSQGGMLDFVGRVARRTLFNYLEYEVVMQGFNAVMNEVTNSLHQASNTQFEEKMQHLYSPTINVTEALKNATTIAREWGGDIVDIQQVIGLWTKNTNSLAAATFLADKAEKMHMASGIETLEVYRASVALSQQLGMNLNKLPGYYDKVAYAALKIAVPLKDLTGKGSEEGLRDIFQGVEKDAAELKSAGMDVNQIIAATALQVQGLGESGAQAGQQLATMFGALQQGGPGRQAFESTLLGVNKNAFSDSKDFMDALFKSVDKLRQLQASGKLHVKPFSDETFKNFLNSLDQIKKLSADIAKNSSGALDKIAQASIDSFQGRMAQAKAAVQAFSITLGNQLLPQATRMLEWFTAVEPSIQHFVPLIIQGTVWIAKFGAALIALEGLQKASQWLREYATANEIARKANFDDAAQMNQVAAAMERNREETVRLTAAIELYTEWQAKANAEAAASVKALDAEAAAAGEAATAMGALSTEEEAVAVAAPGMWTKLGEGVGTLGALASGVGRLAVEFTVLLGAIQLAQGAMDSFDRTKDLDHALSNMNPKHATLGWMVTHPVQTLSDIGSDAADVVQGRNTGSIMHNALLDLAHHKSPMGQQARDLIARRAQTERDLAHANSEGFEGALDRLRANHAIGDENAQAYSLLSRYDSYLKGHPQTPGIQSVKDLEATLQKNYAAIYKALNHPAGQGDTGGHVFANLPIKQKGIEKPESAYSEQVDKTKRISQAKMNAYLENAQAAKEAAATEEKYAKVLGMTADRLKAIHVDRNREVYSTILAAKTADDEVKQLQSSIAHGQGMLASGKFGKNTTAYAHIEKAISMAQAALTKAQAASNDHYEQARYATAQARAADVQDYIDLGLGRYGGLSGISSKASSITSSARDATGGFFEKIAAQGQAQTDLKSLSNEVDAVYQHLHKLGYSATELEPLTKAIGSLNNQGEALSKTTASLLKQFTQFERTSQKALESTTNDNLKSIGSYLVDTSPSYTQADIDYVDALITGFQKYDDAMAALQADYAKLGSEQAAIKGGYDAEWKAATAILKARTAQLSVEKQLTSITAYEKYRRAQITSSPAYGATNNLMSNQVNGWLSNFISSTKLLNGSNGSFGGMLGSWLQSALSSRLQSTVQSLMSSLFGLNDQDPKIEALKQITMQQETNFGAFHDFIQAHINGINTFNSAVETHVNELQKVYGPGGPGNQGGTSDPNNPQAVNVTHVAGQQVNPQGVLDTNIAQVGSTDVSGVTSTPSGSSTTTTSSVGAAVGSSMLRSIASRIGVGGGGALSALTSVGPQSGSSVLSDLFGAGTNSTVSTALGALSMASMFGSIGQGLGGGGGTTGGSILGGLGGAFGAGMGAFLLSGGTGGLAGFLAELGAGVTPLGIGVLAAGAVLGSGAIGPHWGPASNYPDRSDEPTFGNFLANYQGTPYMDPTTGSDINPSSQYNTMVGNQNMAEQLYNYFENPANQQGLSSAAMQQVQQYLALAGTDGYQGLNITGMHNGVFSLTSGQSISFNDLNNLVNNLTDIQSSQGNKPIAPIISINAMGNGSNTAGAYGIGGVYNTPGMDPNTYNAIQQNRFAGYGPNYAYATPNTTGLVPLPNSPTNTANPQSLVQATVNLLLNNQVLAQAVLNVQAGLQNRQLQLA